MFIIKFKSLKKTCETHFYQLTCWISYRCSKSIHQFE